MLIASASSQFHGLTPQYSIVDSVLNVKALSRGLLGDCENFADSSFPDLVLSRPSPKFVVSPAVGATPIMATVTWTLGKSGVELNTANSCSQYLGQYLGYYYCSCSIVHNWPLSTIHGYRSLASILPLIYLREWGGRRGTQRIVIHE